MATAHMLRLPASRRLLLSPQEASILASNTNEQHRPCSSVFTWGGALPRHCKPTVCSASSPATISQGGREEQRAVRFRPCIDIHKGKVKQIVGSTLRDLPDQSSSSADNLPSSSYSSEGPGLVTNFESEKSAGEFARMYKRDDLAGGHVIMLGADPASQSAALEALGAFPGGLQVGGGITPDNARMYLDGGASHVIVTSYVFRDGQLQRDRLRALVSAVGRRRLVLDLSCRKKDGKYMVVTDRWQRFSDLALTQQSVAELAESADEFLVHGVDVEGMRLGIDDELVKILGMWSPIPVTYAGGARTLEDLERMKVFGAGRVDITVGSALDIFGGDLPYERVVKWHNSQRAPTEKEIVV